ncbi:ROK family transcriptional regulator [Aestuariibacter sp. GS-14]|nr:ROK family transcriptional regulator [Aestuariibacter sp. GS-14]
MCRNKDNYNMQNNNDTPTNAVDRKQPLALMPDRLFFHTIKQHGPMSRASIAKLTGISRPTISESAQRLLKQGLVIETKRKTQNKQGRAGIIYEINATKGVILALAIDVKQIQLRLTNLALGVIRDQCFTIDPSWNKQDFIKAVIQIMELSLHDQQAPLLSIGVSVATPVNATTGEIIALPFSQFTVIHGINFKQLFSHHFNCTVTIDNDVNWATLAEKANGIAQQESNFMFIYFGEGIGGGVYFDNHLIKGASGMAGELGHIMIEDGVNLQDYVHKHKLQEALEAGDDLTSHPALQVISRIIASMATVINPNMFVLGGPLTKYPTFIPAIIALTRPQLFTPTLIVPSDAPNFAPLNGVETGAYEVALAQFGLPKPDEVSQ